MAKSYRTKFLVSLAALATVLVVQVPPVPAITADGTYERVGESGRLLCAEITDDFSENLQALDWIGGYITSFNRWHPDFFGLLGDRGFADWITTYCRANPTKSIAHAADTLIETFWSGRALTVPVTTIPSAPQARQRSVPVQHSLRSPQY
jgi:hypothetical protein